MLRSMYRAHTECIFQSLLDKDPSRRSSVWSPQVHVHSLAVICFRSVAGTSFLLIPHVWINFLPSPSQQNSLNVSVSALVGKREAGG